MEMSSVFSSSANDGVTPWAGDDPPVVNHETREQVSTSVIKSCDFDALIVQA